MTLKRSILAFITFTLLMWCRSSWCAEQANPSVAVAGTATQYRTVNFKVPGYLNNPNEQIGGFEITLVIDLTGVVSIDSVDTTGSLISRFDFVGWDTSGSGGSVTVAGIADLDTTPPSAVIGPGNGLLFNMVVNITSDCFAIAETTLTTIRVDTVGSHLAKPVTGEWIDSVQFFNGSVYVPGLCVYGDANANGTINLSDIIYLVSYVFRAGPAPCPEKAGDANRNGQINLTDIIFLVNYVFKGTAGPCR